MPLACPPGVTNSTVVPGAPARLPVTVTLTGAGGGGAAFGAGLACLFLRGGMTFFTGLAFVAGLANPAVEATNLAPGRGAASATVPARTVHTTVGSTRPANNA